MEVAEFEKKKRRKQSVDLTTMVYGKVPPQARELEEVILGAIMIDSACLPEVINLIFKEAFYVDTYQRVFGAILSLYDKNSKIDVTTVIEELKKLEELDTVGGPYAIVKLTNSVVSGANIETHCRIVLEKFLKREAIRVAGEILTEAYEDSSDAFTIYDNADNELLKAQEKVLSGAVMDMRHYSMKVHDQYETVKHTGVLGIQTGILPIDRIFSGLVAPDLFIIAARPGQGKTALALSITHTLSVVNGIPGSWFSLEMDGVQLTRRLVSIESGISHELIRQGKVYDGLENKLFNAISKVGVAPIFIEDRGTINIRSLRTRAIILKKRNKIKYIVVDYIQLMNSIGKKGQNREGEVSEISRGLKLLAKEIELPIIALSQLSREVEKRSDKMPQLSDLRESGAIEQDADEVMFLMRPEYYNLKEHVTLGGKEYAPPGLCIGKGDKNRHGECKSFAMWFNAPTMHFTTHPMDEGSQNYFSSSLKEQEDKYSQSKLEEPPF